VRIVSWNINGLATALQQLHGVDVALLQEVPPLPDAGEALITSEGGTEWRIAGWEKRDRRTAIVRPPGAQPLMLEPYPTQPLGHADVDSNTLVVSRPGSIAAATLTLGNDSITLISVYAPWERPVPYAEGGWIYADASAHRIISDVSALVGSQRGHRVIVAGDFNILRGYGEDGSDYWRARYQTVFDRFAAIGIPFAGPEAPNGHPVASRPTELPANSTTVPTFNNQGNPTRQLDFVFASAVLHDRLMVTALNGPDEWGPSDHCRIQIDLE
jgi:hypothetical protein